jgi:hypothetical protein
VWFAGLFLAVQLTLIATTGWRPNHAFGFRMFHEYATVKVRLWRRVRGHPGLVRVDNGLWWARDRAGQVHRMAWFWSVAPFGPAWLDATVKASYGADWALAAYQYALDWVATHTPEDAETETLEADVTVQNNGHAPVTHHLTSVVRR